MAEFFIQCGDCNNIYLIDDEITREIDFQCPSCGNRKKENKVLSRFVLLQCPKCKQFWPKFILRKIIHTGLVKCLDPKCNTPLYVRYEREILEKENEKKENNIEKNEENITNISNSQIQTQSSQKSLLTEAFSPFPNKEKKQDNDKKIINENNIQKEKDQEKNIIHNAIRPEIDEDEDVKEKEGKFVYLEDKKQLIETLEKEQVEREQVEREQVEREQVEKELIENEYIYETNAPFDFEIELLETKDTDYSINDALNDFNYFLSTSPDLIKIEQDKVKKILENSILNLPFLSHFIVQEPIQFIYYVGDIRGNFEYYQQLFKYLQQVIELYPVVKIVFLGNYLEGRKTDWLIVPFMALFAYLYPDNVLFLRGSLDFAENFEKYKIYNQIYDYGEKEKWEIRDIIYIYQLAINFFARFPVIHLSIMTDNQTKIMAVHSSIPIDTFNPSEPIILDELNTGELDSYYPMFRDNSLDDFSWVSIEGKPSNIIDEFDPGDTKKAPQFGELCFYTFLQKNNLYLVIRGNEIIKEGYKFYFTGNRLVTLYSGIEMPIINLDNTEIIDSSYIDNVNYNKVEPKLIRVLPSEAPSLIEATPEGFKQDLIDTFGIEEEN